MNQKQGPTTMRQRGVAVVTALLIAALVAVMTAQWFVAQDALGRTIEVQRAGAQARWLLTGATDWGMVILRDLDTDKQVDHLREPWAYKLAPTRLTDERGQLEAFGSGVINDAQGRFNLADLTKDGGLDGNGIAALQRLLEALGLQDKDNEAVAIARAIVSLTPAPTSGSPRQPMPRITSALDLRGMKGISDSTLEGIALLTTIYPKENANKDRTSPINFNTAEASVIASVHPMFAGGLAQAIVSKRESLGFFKNKTDLIRVQFDAIGKAIDGGTSPQDKDLENLIDVRTSFFLATGRIQLSRTDIARQTLIWRRDRQLEVVWVRDI